MKLLYLIPATLISLAATMHAAAVNLSESPQLYQSVYRSVFTLAAVNECGIVENIKGVETDRNSPRNPVVETVTLPTDGVVPTVLPTTPAEIAPAREVVLKELYEPIPVEPLPSPLIAPDAENIITLTDAVPSSSQVYNPWDPRGIRPLKLTKITLRVGAVMDSVRPVAIINGRLLLRGSVIDGFSVTRIEPTYVILTHDGKHLQLPAGRQIQVRMSK